jgi:hypothetical protein
MNFNEHDFKKYLWDIYGQTICSAFTYHYVCEPPEHDGLYNMMENYIEKNVSKLELIVHLGDFLSN